MAKRNRNKQQQQYQKPMLISNKLLDIVIPVHSRFDLLGRCLDAIPHAAGEVSYNVICVDNASPLNESVQFYDSRKDIDYLIQNKENTGFPHACNQGAARRNSPLLFFLNSDVILEPGSLEILVSEMNDPKIGVAGMLLVFPEYAEGLNPRIRPANKVQHVGMETDIHGKWIHPLIGWSRDHYRVMARRQCYAVTGAAFLTRRVIWNRIKGFDEAYGRGTYEDVSFCMSVREMGYNIVVNPKAAGIHFTGATSEKMNIPYAMDHNRFIFLQKWAQKMSWSECNAW